MKKVFSMAAALLLALGAWAEEKDAADASLKLFDSFVSGLKESLPEDAAVRGDRDHRFVYLDVLMPVDSTAPFDPGEAKRGVMMYLKGSAELFKTLKITLFVNFVATDRRIRTVVVTPQELAKAAADPEE